MTLTETVRVAWGWCGVDPVEIVGENDFGNLMVKDCAGRYWRLCPEDLSCTVIARDREELDVLSRDQAFLRDWYMSALVDEAFQRLGALPEGCKYCLKIPGVLGGEYGGDNLATIHLNELIRASGDIAHQIKDLPDGAKVRLKILDDAV
jgi:hypothetical protein